MCLHLGYAKKTVALLTLRSGLSPDADVALLSTLTVMSSHTVHARHPWQTRRTRGSRDRPTPTGAALDIEYTGRPVKTENDKTGKP